MTEQASWDSYNDFLMHGSLDRMTKILARYELFKRVIDLPGDIVEGGIFRGAGLLYWAKIIQIFNPLSNRRVIGFDTLEGYPDSTLNQHDMAAGNSFIEEVSYTSVLTGDLLDLARASGVEHRIEIIKGDATNTIKEYVIANPGFRVALLNIDFDVYEPTAAALEHLYPKIVPGGIVLLDEYGERGWGEADAADEFFKSKDVTYHTLPWALSPSAFLVKQPGQV